MVEVLIKVLLKDFIVEDTSHLVNHAHEYWFRNHYQHIGFSDWIMENYNLDICWENSTDLLLTGSNEDYTAFVLRWS